MWPRAQNTQWMGAAAENYVQCPCAGRPLRRPLRAHQRGEHVQMTGVAVITSPPTNILKQPCAGWTARRRHCKQRRAMRAVAAERSWDGKYQLLDNIKNNPDGLTLYLCLGQAIFPAATCLSISPTKWTRAAQRPKPKRPTMWYAIMWCPFETVPRVKFTEEESIAGHLCAGYRQLRHGECGEVHHGRKEPERVGRLRGGTEQYAG